jgi:hypothetical protein
MTAKRIVTAALRRLNPSFYRKKTYQGRLISVMNGPYPASVYKNFLKLIVESDHDYFVDFQHPPKVGRELACQWFVRHDIDTPNCLQQLPLLLDIALDFDIRPACFLRVGCDAYDLSLAQSVIRSYSGSGIVFGLHSECYLDDDWDSRLAREVNLFKDVLGFQPIAVNAHGYGQYRIDTRLDFYKGLNAGRALAHGFTFTDVGNPPRDYEVQVQDCHSSGSSPEHNDFRAERRQVLSDFINLPPAGLYKNAILLTHPGYWTE